MTARRILEDSDGFQSLAPEVDDSLTQQSAGPLASKLSPTFTKVGDDEDVGSMDLCNALTEPKIQPLEACASRLEEEVAWLTWTVKLVSRQILDSAVDRMLRVHEARLNRASALWT
ncbi:unnamed protein product [Protopolystoma xenopodis]|uniref:Uncharacterized protein n=1 Tax=Protopolystoma xenopodis TaxID=117903 RepID=A0A448X178_9PLAT|nr:unnamed protein product [Protopolystoma xenopodis]